MTTHTDLMTASPPVRRARRPWAWLLAWLGAAMDRREQRLRLATLDPHLLRDIGLTRAEAQAEAEHPCWRA
ncbi:DUF1127 domain-containing protein [Neoroseomonas lacus]|uniref:YjiS-like domain-containing protein n=1 Tax=Neoroseomonas lacus TaxID=287609 RepID=A0A917NH28_9PROT|nr:DUF1127 domain-containing protein [Neoroseomonas lacus]GGJ00525.1 hypothetical protein GCM10011320_04180 [Neoroseomonas lacus]